MEGVGQIQRSSEGAVADKQPVEGASQGLVRPELLELYRQVNWNVRL